MESEDSQTDYELILLLTTLGATKIRVMLILAHMYPKAVTATQLSNMLGYSLKARTIYRGILNDLEERDLVYLDKLTPKVSSIRLNHDNPLLRRLIDLSQKYGTQYQTTIINLMERKE